MQQSLMMASNLFLYNRRLRVHDYSEADFLHKVWSFLYHLYDDNVIDAILNLLGMELELVMMDAPAGHSVRRISRSERYAFPDCIDTFATDLIPLLEIVWKGNEVMINTMNTINKRRKKADLITKAKYTTALSPSFTRQRSP